MEKYGKHIIVGLGGSGLIIAGAIILSAVFSAMDATSIAQHGFMWEISRLQMMPVFIIGAILGAIGAFCILGTMLNLATKDN